MKNASVKSLATHMARDPAWDCLSNGKAYDENGTVVLRVYHHSGTNVYAAYGQSSPKEGDEVVSVELNPKRERAIADVAKTCHLPAGLAKAAE